MMSAMVETTPHDPPTDIAPDPQADAVSSPVAGSPGQGTSDEQPPVIQSTPAEPGTPPPLGLYVDRWSARTTAAELWELMWRPSVQRLWLGEESVVSLHSGHRFSLNLGGSLWRTGRVLQIHPGRFRALVSHQTGSPVTDLFIAIVEDGTACRLSIDEDDFDSDPAREEAETYGKIRPRAISS
jgi:hypothetical protein